MSAVFQDLSVTINQRHPSCVLDPALALSPFGIPLVRRLTEVMELWVVRELLHILDNPYFYVIGLKSLKTFDNQCSTPEDVGAMIQSLEEWERIRAELDPGSMKIFFIGDSPGESMLPARLDPSLVWRFEILCCSLDNRLKSPQAFALAFRDAVALAVALPSALILTQLKETDDGTPAICNELEKWGVRTEKASEDHWLKLERNLIRQHLVLAGVAKWCWSGLRLGVLHITAPSATTIRHGQNEETNLYLNDLTGEEDFDTLPREIDYWQGAKAFLYAL